MVAVPVDGAGLLSALDTLPRAFTYPQRLEVHLASVLLSGLLLFVLRPLPPGLSRALVAIPVTLLNFLLPFLFDGDKEMMTNVSIFIVTSSLSSFKALGWALNRGPLVRPLNLGQFLFVYLCPITPREELGAVSGERQAAANGNKKDDDAQHTTAAAAGGGPPRHGGRLREKGLTPAQSLVAFALKGAALAAVCYVLSTFDLPRLARSELYIVSLYCGLSMGMDAPAALAGSLLGLDISPHFDNPFAATSFAELWNKRWNLTVGNALRFLIYDPINELRLVKNPKQSAKFSPLRRLVGVLAVFAMSGFMHEVLYWYFQREWLGGVWQLYFTLWGVLVIVEGILKKILKSAGITIPPWLGWLYTNAVSTIMIDRLWWGPLMARGITEKSVAHAITGARDAAAYFGLEHWLAGLKVAGLKLA